MQGTYSPLGANSHISNQTNSSNFFATWEDEIELEGDKTVAKLDNAAHMGYLVDLTGAEIGMGGSCCRRRGGFLDGVDNLSHIYMNVNTTKVKSKILNTTHIPS